MNQYGSLAQRMWTQHAPSAVEQLENPTEFFAELGDQIAARIEVMVEAQESSIPMESDYAARVEELMAIRHQAEEIALTEMVYEPVGEMARHSAPVLEQLEDLLGELPAPGDLYAEIRQIETDAEFEAEDMGWEAPKYDEEQSELLETYRELIPLLEMAPETLSQNEQQELLAKLQPYLSMIQ